VFVKIYLHQFKQLLFQNLLKLCQIKQLWFQNLLSLLAHLHRALHQILDLHHLLHLQISHHPLHLLIDPHPHLQIQLDHLLHYHLILHLRNHLILDQLVQVRLVPHSLTQQFDLLLEQDQLKFYLIQNFLQLRFLNCLKR
jgi:hypothetical protein